MKTLGLVVHPTNLRAKEAADSILGLATAQNLAVVDAAAGSAADVVVALGGDGTILRAAQYAWALDVPLLGVNLGKLGFLSTINIDRLQEVLDDLTQSRFRIESRMMLEAAAYSGHDVTRVMALNEFVLERGTLSRVVAIRVSVGVEEVATYTADGFIVSTPTGSTAYSLSAGGPVVEPEVQAIILTSVCAHYPLWRSIVLGPDRTVVLETPRDSVAFAADGRPVGTLGAGSRVSICSHERPLKMMTLEHPNFYDKLRSRFHLEPGH
ncbi:MAG TPA: NAD(+)/NADH kinase [Actinomycetota bacterium]|nr:NAD(+)/NADH kinase [Actinomycetota bacterium]